MTPASPRPRSAVSADRRHTAHRTGRGGRGRLGMALFAVAFGTNVSTPLLLLYQDHLAISTFATTALFAVYPLGLLPALLWAGPASDALGRRRTMTPGVAASAVASIVMILGRDNLAALYAGRLLLGAVSGVVFVSASAWMQELDRHRLTDPLWPSQLTGMLLYGGFGVGPFVAGALAQWAPRPLVLPYLVHIAFVAAGLIALRRVPETVVAPTGASIRPNLGVPADARRPFAQVVVPTALAVFGFASLSFALFPILLRPAMRGVAVFATGVVALVTAGAIFGAQQIVGRVGIARAAPAAMGFGAAGCALGIAAFATDQWTLVFPSALALGVASGLAVTSGLRFVDILTAPETRGAMTGAFYAVAYAAMTLPALVASVARSETGYIVILTAVALTGVCTMLWLRRATRRLPTLVDR